MNLVVLFETDDAAEDMVKALGVPLDEMDKFEGLTGYIDNVRFTVEVDPASGMWGLYSVAASDKAAALLARVFPDRDLVAGLDLSRSLLGSVTA